MGRPGHVGSGRPQVVNPLPARGEIWWIDLADAGTRPAVVLSRDQAIPRLRHSLVAPCTTTIRGLASEVELDPEVDPIPVASAINLDSAERVDISALTQRIGRLSDARMREVCDALAVAIDCI